MTEPTETEIIELVLERPEGMPANELLRALVDLGHAFESVQHALQRALDKGIIKAGPGFVLHAESQPTKAFA